MPGCGVHGNDKDARSRGNLPDTGYGLHAAEFGHGNIQQDEIGPERLREPDACEPVPRLARDRQAGLDADELFQAAAEQGVIFDYQYRWHVVSPCADALRPGCAGAEMPRLF